jgi:hypothetical protein
MIDGKMQPELKAQESRVLSAAVAEAERLVSNALLPHISRIEILEKDWSTKFKRSKQCPIYASIGTSVPVVRS